MLFLENAELLFVRINEYSNILGDTLLAPDITIPMGSICCSDFEIQIFLPSKTF